MRQECNFILDKDDVQYVDDESFAPSVFSEVIDDPCAYIEFVGSGVVVNNSGNQEYLSDNLVVVFSKDGLIDKRPINAIGQDWFLLQGYCKVCVPFKNLRTTAKAKEYIEAQDDKLCKLDSFGCLKLGDFLRSKGIPL